MNLFGAMAFGIVHGVRHTFEPDHLAAVSVLVSNSRGVRRSIGLGALWGLGHTLSLTVVCLGLVLVDAQLPASVDAVFTLLVGILLVLLGGRALLHARREHIRSDATHPHAHYHPHRSVRSPLQAFAVGTIHGMAGSGAITALAVAGMPSPLVGMATVSALAGVTFARVARPWIARLLGSVVGALSIIIGVVTIAVVVH